MSSSGQYQTALANYHFSGNKALIYNSTDYGITWTANTIYTLLSFTSTTKPLAMSTSGQYQTILSNKNTYANIYNSTDYGVTWKLNQSQITTTYWSSICMTGSGQYQVATLQDNTLYTSVDFGITWNIVLNTNLSAYCNYMSMSIDGKYLYGNNGTSIISSITPSFIMECFDASLNNSLSVGGDITANSRLFMNKSSIVLSNSTTYSSTPITLSTPVSQNVFVNVATATLTMPTMTTAFSGTQINIRKIGTGMNTALTINAPASASVFVASGTVSTTVTSITLAAETSGTSFISDGIRWYQFP
jgi:hypothetical protein